MTERRLRVDTRIRSAAPRSVQPRPLVPSRRGSRSSASRRSLSTPTRRRRWPRRCTCNCSPVLERPHWGNFQADRPVRILVWTACLMPQGRLSALLAVPAYHRGRRALGDAEASVSESMQDESALASLDLAGLERSRSICSSTALTESFADFSVRRPASVSSAWRTRWCCGCGRLTTNWSLSSSCSTACMLCGVTNARRARSAFESPGSSFKPVRTANWVTVRS